MELVQPSVHHGLLAVSPLKRGRSGARESRRVLPVPPAHVEAIWPHVSRQVWALVPLQLLTAARSGELVGMRPCDIDTSGRIWVYRPECHKTDWHGHERTIYVGPKAQAVLRPFLDGRALNAPLFSPQEAEAERRARLHAERRTPLHHGNRPGSNRSRKPKRPPAEQYTPESYNRAVARGAKAADVPHWHVHRLRHSAATALRKEFGLEAARIILGHRYPAITDLYAELDHERAIEVVQKIG